MEFQTFHKEFFNATNGSFSIVTERENYDSQITLTDVETELIIRHFGAKSIHVGNVADSPEMARKPFLLYPSMITVFLNLVFPKPLKSELRLYISTRAGFKPPAGQIWFLYESQTNELVIGSMDEAVWASLGQIDEIDESYQAQIENTLSVTSAVDVDPKGQIKTSLTGERRIFVRDPRIAVLRFNRANYTCEINPDHNTFLAERTRRPYMEAHHYIPMCFQHLFDYPLDNVDNVTSLCPTCHRGIHHAVTNTKLELISDLYRKRPELQGRYSLEYIAQFYNALRP